MRVALTVLMFLLCVQPVYADSGAPPFMEFFEATASELDVPLTVVLAIARLESGINPWTLNIEGRSFHFATKDEALTEAEGAQSDGRSFDVGIMQINRWWLDRYGISLEAAFDPLANIYLGCWIFKQELIRHKNLRAAIGAYHSPNPLRASRYADQVMTALARGPVAQAAGQQPKAEIAIRSGPPKAVAVATSASTHRLPSPEPATFKVGCNVDHSHSMKVRKK